MHERAERTRNAALVKKVKEHHGYRCAACGFDFRLIYGKAGEEYIEAHHLTPLNKIEGDAAISLDPVKDFAVLCGNCHRVAKRRVIWRRDKNFTIRGSIFPVTSV